MDSRVCVMWEAAVAARERETEAEGGELLVNQGSIGRAGLLGCLCSIPWGHLAQSQSPLVLRQSVINL